ncbi:hypothetical protein GEU84_012940 [Fertoebacter nigrum]|uniref:Uncharacterized protein n=1 Tax=Fertoeibacter niger TaxID=2656921 RepID=A0A8X8H0H8_9RHOB|nr:hypothetical protein [Fertoeibacter niger]NUB45298.1 hypothetical protein [Fertoeibacter niger]
MLALVRPVEAGRAAGPSLRKTADTTPQGLLKSLIPEDRSERVQIRFQLNNAGWTGAHAVRNFFLMRLALAMLGPVILLTALGLAQTAVLPDAV